MKSTSFALDGLQTDPGPFSGAPDGALVEAQNVVCERQGLIEPRGGWILGANTVMKAAGASIIHGIAPTNVPTFYIGKNGATYTMANTAAVTGPTSFAQGKVNSTYAKGRALFTSEDGVCEAPPYYNGAYGTTIAYRAGLPAPSMPYAYCPAAGGTSWLASGQTVAYRFTLVRRRGDGTTMESAPTAPLIVRNTSGFASTVYIIALPGLTYTPYDVNNTFDALQVGDALNVYRSPVLTTGTGTPSDVMRLRATLTITGGALQDFEDKLADTEWNGPELYSNARREGILQARDRPGYARDICTYNGMTLYAGSESPHRVSVTCKAIGDISRDPQQAICTKQVTVTTAVGSPNLTLISATDVVYLAPGQWITLTTGEPGVADARFPIDTQISTVNVAAGTAVMTKNALVAGATTAYVWDWISVTDGATVRYQYAQPAASTLIRGNMWLQSSNATGTRMGGYAPLEYAWNNYASRVKDVVLHASGSDEANGQPEVRNVLMRFERASMSVASFTIKSTKPNAFDRQVDNVTGIASKMDGGDARIGISVNDIPDALPLTNYVDVGDQASPIYRVVVAKDTVIIVKADGLYQLFGSSKSDVTIKLLDNTVTMPPGGADIAANWITKRGDTVYMMSSNGPVAITDQGVTPIGMPIMETLRETLWPSFSRVASFDYAACGASGATPYVLWSYVIGSTATTYAYNTLTSAWTTWTSRRPVTAYWPGTLGQYAGMGYTEARYYDRRSDMGLAITGSTWPLTGDTCGVMTATINSVVLITGNRYTITIAAGSEWTPTVGDMMIRSGNLFTVEAVTSATVFEVAAATVAPTTGACTWEEGYPIRLTWTARTLGTIASEKRNVQLAYGFALRALLLRMQATFQTSYAPGGVVTTASPTVESGWQGAAAADITASLLFAPELFSVGIPQDVTLDWGLRVGLALTQARSWFSLGAVTIDALDSGLRTGRLSA